MAERSALFTSERAIIQKELTFFAEVGRGSTQGILTERNINTITGRYPTILKGAVSLYDHIQDEALDLNTQEGFFVRYLEKQFMEGHLVSNQDVANLEERLAAGDFSRQFDAYLRYRKRVGAGGSSGEGKVTGEYRQIRNDNDAIFNKRTALSHVVHLRQGMPVIYGEVDYPRALVTEMLLQAPFGHAVLNDAEVDAEGKARHQAYIEDIGKFAKSFDPDARFQAFEQLTDQYPMRWVTEASPDPLPDFDRPLLDQAYLLAGDILLGRGEVEALYPILKNTVLRRGQLFLGEMTRDALGGNRFKLSPRDSTPVSFEDIAGYQEQKDFYLNLLAKVKNNDPIVQDIRMVIAAGEPGRGKSLGVQAFLNALPENAKGVFVKQGGMHGELKGLAELARIHPDLQLFAVIGDIDAYAGDRLHSRSTWQFLDIDSEDSDAIPRNLHLLATTNRPDVIDSAVIRPGRTAKILTYGDPTPESVRDIAALHSNKYELNLSEAALDLVAQTGKGLSPDEIRHIVWSLKFEGIADPSKEDLDKIAGEIRRKHKLEKKTGFGS